MEENNNQQLIDMAHGMQEDIKMKMLEMIQQAASPYDILYEVANFLEDVSAERGYAQHIIDNIHTVYGIALKEKKPLVNSPMRKMPEWTLPLRHTNEKLNS